MRAQSDFSDLGDEATGSSATATSGRQDSSPPDFTLEPAGSAAQRDKLNEIVAGGRQRLGDRPGTEFNFFLEKAGMTPPSGGASWLGLDGVLRPPTREFATPGAAQPAGNPGIAPADDPTSLTSVASAMAGPTSFLLPTLPAAIARKCGQPRVSLCWRRTWRRRRGRLGQAQVRRAQLVGGAYWSAPFLCASRWRRAGEPGPLRRSHGD